MERKKEEKSTVGRRSVGRSVDGEGKMQPWAYILEFFLSRFPN